MPAIVLISVLLPAPLSPTTAVTWPIGMSRLTLVSTRTGPKLLPISTSRSNGASPSLAAVWVVWVVWDVWVVGVVGLAAVPAGSAWAAAASAVPAWAA